MSPAVIKQTGDSMIVPSERTKRKPIIKGDIAYIPLGGRHGGVAIVDADNAWVAGRSWSQNNNGYAHATIDDKRVLMHLLIFGTKPKGLVNDHINRNKLDNRRANIRTVTVGRNVVNSKLWRTNKSGHKGVSWHKKGSKWFVYIDHNCKRINIGLFSDIGDAILARKGAEVKYRGRDVV